MMKLEKKTWWPQLVADKDKLSLRELASRYGATAGAIKSALERNGIERVHAPPGPRNRRPTALAAAAAAPAPAAKAAPAPAAKRKPGRPKKAVAPAVSAAPPAAPAVAAAPPVAAAAAKKKPGRPASDSKLLPYMDMLGKVADGEIARLAGLSSKTVANFRKARSIAPVSALTAQAAPKAEAVAAPAKPAPAKAAPAPAPAKAAPVASAPPAAPAPVVEAPAPSAPAPEPVAAPAVSMKAWRINDGAKGGIVVASSLVEAATKAMATGSNVVSIEWIGDVIA